MRRLPIFICADVSESMAGEALASMQSGVKELLEALLRDPQMMELGALSILSFGNDAKVELRLTGVMDAHVPTFELSSGTSLGRVFELLTTEIHDNIKKTTAEVRGDFKPIIFLITDGQPTDKWRKGYSLFRMAYPTLTIHAVGCGDDVDFSVLKEITPNTYAMKEMNADSFRKLFQCVTASVRSVSACIAGAKNVRDDLTLWDDDVLRKPSDQECIPLTEPRQILIPGVCSNTGKHFLVRYKKNDAGVYCLSATHRIGARLQGSDASGGSVSTGKLNSKGIVCPYCENGDVFYCGNCHEWVCYTPNVMRGHCPDCGWSGRLVSGSFDLSRSRG